MSVEQYRALIRDFPDSVITAPEFETRYLTAMKNQKADLGRDVFFILQDLFEDVDAYTHEWPPPPGLQYVISEDELRQEARTALDALDQVTTP